MFNDHAKYDSSLEKSHERRAKILLFLEKFEEVFSKFNHSNPQAVLTALESHPDVLERRIKRASLQPSSTDMIQLVETELTTVIQNRLIKFGSFFARDAKHIGPFADRLNSTPFENKVCDQGVTGLLLAALFRV